MKLLTSPAWVGNRTAALAFCLVAVLGCQKPSAEPTPAAAEPTKSPKTESATAESPKTEPTLSHGREQEPAAIPAEPPTKPARPPESAPERTSFVKQKPKFDPIAVNGKFFEGWTRPKLALVITGRQDGYLEPCGCAGIENQKGGLSRRQSLMRELAAKDWPLAAVDVGSMVRRFGKQAEVQFGICAEALRTMRYSAVGFGPSDLRLSAGEVAAVVAGDQPGSGIFVSANVDLFGLAPKTRIVEAGGMKLGITSVLGDEYRRQVNNTELQMVPAKEALAGVVGQLAETDVKILLANATLAESRDLAAAFPQFDIVVSAGGADEPPAQAAKVEGSKALLIEVGHKAMYAIVLGFYDDPSRPVRYQRVALDSRFPDSPKMKDLMTTYQSQLEALGWSGLGLRPARHPQSRSDNPLAGQFVGGASCKECHAGPWDVYIKSNHAHATRTLVDLKPARQFDPECVSCHVTGWNPQEFFPYISGYDSLEHTPELAGQSCEDCHGPGAAHIAAERGSDAKLQAEWRRLLHQDKATADEQSCRKCHDLDNSPDFDFEKYWAEIEH
jgi:hypothetical protein